MSYYNVWPNNVAGRGPQWCGAVQSVPGAVKNLCLDWTDQLTGTSKDPKSPEELLNAKKLEEEEDWEGGEEPLTLMWKQTERLYQSVGPFIPQQHWPENKKYLNSVKAHIEIKCQVYQKSKKG